MALGEGNAHRPREFGIRTPWHHRCHSHPGNLEVVSNEKKHGPLWLFAGYFSGMKYSDNMGDQTTQL